MCIFNPASLDLNILEFGKVKLDEKKVFVQVKNQIEHKVFFSSNGSTRYYFLVYLNFDPIWISLTLALEVSQFHWTCFARIQFSHSHKQMMDLLLLKIDYSLL
jgi:hypothetical protein